MRTVSEALYIACFILAAGGGLYTLFSIFCVLMAGVNHKSSESSPERGFPPVSILKPLRGADYRLKENLAGFCRQDYPDYEVLLGLRSTKDGAYGAALEIERMFPEKVRLVVGHGDLGANRKVSNLYRLSQSAKHDLVAVSDSDMKVDGGYLKTIVSEYMENENTGLVTSLYRITEPVSVGAAFESLSIALDFIPSVLVAKVVERKISFGLGASMLFSRERFEETGGFRAIADHLADDYQVGHRLYGKGYEVVLSKYVMEDMEGPMRFLDYLLHQLRWARTYRASRPKGYIGYGITHFFAYCFFLSVFWPGALTFSALALSFFLRALGGFAVNRRFIGRTGWGRWLFLLPAKDMLSFGIWLLSFAGRQVAWRGDIYRVTRTGELRKMDSERNPEGKRGESG